MPNIRNDIDTIALDAFLESKQRSLRLPGLAVAVVQDDQMLYERGLGYAAPGRVMTPYTPLIIGSLSKSFTALAIMQLVEAGKVGLDVPIQHYIPWFQLADSEAAAAITTRHLLTHTSGISTYAGRELLGGSGGKTIEQSVRELCTLKLTQSIGTAFQYSNTNYLIAGLIVEIISGQSYASYIQEHIFAPLGMSQSHTSEHEAVADGLATGYRWWFGLPVPARVPYLDDALPAAFLISSAHDQARYLIACLDAGRTSQAVLSPASFAELFRAQTTTPTGSSYTLGWRRSQLDGTTVIFHTGEVANFRAEMMLLPELRLGIIVLVNINNGLIADLGLDRIVPGIVSVLRGKQPATRKLTFKRFSVALNGLIALLTVLQAAWTWRVCSSRKHSRSSGLLIDLIVPLGTLGVVPWLFRAPWSLLRYYVPDVVAWLRFVMLPLVAVRLIVRLVRCLKK
jgi:CubicO group peptidase (beta-lactamase class C family)